MMKRDEWEFEYTAARLSDASRDRRDHRLERLQWWEQEKAKVMQEVRDSGIEVQESVANQYSNMSSAFGPQVAVRTDLQRKLTECHIKIKEHNEAAMAYEGWRQVLDANPEGRLKLHHDDWLFFFGK
jgi:histidinol-phosphate/aromatic aminotransferase/cobyric acid decarboxylase-like protein